MFAEATVRAVPATIEAGITSAKVGRPDYEKAREQHDRFVGALERCGLAVTTLRADDRLPDSVFVEDTALAERGYEVIELEMSEFRKLDWGLSCLSLRLPAPGGGS